MVVAGKTVTVQIGKEMHYVVVVRFGDPCESPGALFFTAA